LGFWQGLEPNQTEPLVKTRTAGGLPGPVANTTNKQLQFQIRRFNAETEATTWSFADMERVTIELERDIYGITSNEQKRFKNKFSIRIIEFEA